MLISGAIEIGVLVPMSFSFFKTVVWVGFAVPLIAVQPHELAADLKERLELRR